MSGQMTEVAPAQGIRLSTIVIGARHRKDMGDLRTLAASIEKVGLLQPIGITPGLLLVFGERRLRSFELLGRQEIPARIIDIESIAQGEFHENEIRKDFTLEEQVHIGRAIKAEIGNRQGRRTDKEPPEKIPEVRSGTETRQIAAARAGFGNDRTYRQAKEIVEAAEADPERFGGLVAHMNETGRVDGPYKRLKAMMHAEEIRKDPTPPAAALRGEQALPRGSRITVPQGVTPEDMCREAMRKEEEQKDGMTAREAARAIRVDVGTYRKMRDIVKLADRTDLLASDRATVSQALDELNREHRPGAAHERVISIVDRVWGNSRARRGRSREQSAARRLEDFDLAFGYVVQMGTAAADIEIPYLSPRRAKELAGELGAAVTGLGKFRKKIKDLTDE